MVGKLSLQGTAAGRLMPATLYVSTGNGAPTIECQMPQDKTSAVVSPVKERSREIISPVLSVLPKSLQTAISYSLAVIGPCTLRAGPAEKSNRIKSDDFSVDT